MASCNGELFFNADDGVNGIELWKSNGTSAGTIMVKNINGISSGSFPREITSYKGNVYFSANTTNEGNELWKSDGTTNGTVMVKDIFAGIGGGQPNSFLEFKGSLLFHASNGVDKTNTWKTDGSSTGTIPHPNLNLNYGLKNVNGVFENPAYAIVNNSTLFFSSINGGFGEELWKFDVTLRINENYKNDLGITVYPNPSKGIINLELTDLKEAELSIYNVAGQKVLTKKINEKKSRLDLNTLDNGIYFLNFKNNDGTTVKKIILDK
ncbi:ELWxxDGT repeat protein [Flavobacterium myungsuense]